MVYEELSVEYGECSLKNIIWKMQKEETSMENGASDIEYGQWSTEHGIWRMIHDVYIWQKSMKKEWIGECSIENGVQLYEWSMENSVERIGME